MAARIMQGQMTTGSFMNRRGDAAGLISVILDIQRRARICINEARHRQQAQWIPLLTTSKALLLAVPGQPLKAFVAETQWSRQGAIAQIRLSVSASNAPPEISLCDAPSAIT